MAKRLTDTDKWGKAWFRKLPTRMKTTWEFLRDNCDHAGVWDIDVDSLSFHVGEPVSIAEIEAAFGERIERIGDKYLLKGFVEFQYGVLNPANRVHLSVMKRLERVVSFKPLVSPLIAPSSFPEAPCEFPEGAKDKDKDKEQEKDTDKDQEKVNPKLSEEDVRTCCRTWKATLDHYGIPANIAPHEFTEIGRAIQRWGFETVNTALLGARHEPKTERYDPKPYVSLRRVFGKDKNGQDRIGDFLNWGRAAIARESAELTKKSAQVNAEKEIEESVTTDPVRIRELMGDAGKRLFGRMPV